MEEAAELASASQRIADGLQTWIQQAQDLVIQLRAFSLRAVQQSTSAQPGLPLHPAAAAAAQATRESAGATSTGAAALANEGVAAASHSLTGSSSYDTAAEHADEDGWCVQQYNQVDNSGSKHCAPGQDAQQPAMYLVVPVPVENQEPASVPTHSVDTGGARPDSPPDVMAAAQELRHAHVQLLPHHPYASQQPGMVHASTPAEARDAHIQRQDETLATTPSAPRPQPALPAVAALASLLAATGGAGPNPSESGTGSTGCPQHDQTDAEAHQDVAMHDQEEASGSDVADEGTDDSESAGEGEACSMGSDLHRTVKEWEAATESVLFCYKSRDPESKRVVHVMGNFEGAAQDHNRWVRQLNDATEVAARRRDLLLLQLQLAFSHRVFEEPGWGVEAAGQEAVVDTLAALEDEIRVHFAPDEDKMQEEEEDALPLQGQHAHEGEDLGEDEEAADSGDESEDVGGDAPSDHEARLRHMVRLKAERATAAQPEASTPGRCSLECAAVAVRRVLGAAKVDCKHERMAQAVQDVATGLCASTTDLALPGRLAAFAQRMRLAGAQEVLEAVAGRVQAVVERWEAKGLTRLHAGALKARKQALAQQSSLLQDQMHLQLQLCKLLDELARTHMDAKDAFLRHTTRHCKSLEPTIEDIQECAAKLALAAMGREAAAALQAEARAALQHAREAKGTSDAKRTLPVVQPEALGQGDETQDSEGDEPEDDSYESSFIDDDELEEGEEVEGQTVASGPGSGGGDGDDGGADEPGSWNAARLRVGHTQVLPAGARKRLDLLFSPTKSSTPGQQAPHTPTAALSPLEPRPDMDLNLDQDADQAQPADTHIRDTTAPAAAAAAGSPGVTELLQPGLGSVATAARDDDMAHANVAGEDMSDDDMAPAHVIPSSQQEGEPSEDIDMLHNPEPHLSEAGTEQHSDYDQVESHSHSADGHSVEGSEDEDIEVEEAAHEGDTSVVATGSPTMADRDADRPAVRKQAVLQLHPQLGDAVNAAAQTLRVEDLVEVWWMSSEPGWPRWRRNARLQQAADAATNTPAVCSVLTASGSAQVQKEEPGHVRPVPPEQPSSQVQLRVGEVVEVLGGQDLWEPGVIACVARKRGGRTWQNIKALWPNHTGDLTALEAPIDLSTLPVPADLTALPAITLHTRAVVYLPVSNSAPPAAQFQAVTLEMVGQGTLRRTLAWDHASGKWHGLQPCLPVAAYGHRQFARYVRVPKSKAVVATSLPAPKPTNIPPEQVLNLVEPALRRLQRAMARLPCAHWAPAVNLLQRYCGKQPVRRARVHIQPLPGLNAAADGSGSAKGNRRRRSSDGPRRRPPLSTGSQQPKAPPRRRQRGSDDETDPDFIPPSTKRQATTQATPASQGPAGSHPSSQLPLPSQGTLGSQRERLTSPDKAQRQREAADKKRQDKAAQVKRQQDARERQLRSLMRDIERTQTAGGRATGGEHSRPLFEDRGIPMVAGCFAQAKGGLKAHQWAGLQAIWKCLVDEHVLAEAAAAGLSSQAETDSVDLTADEPGGFILAHSMGLGKTLSTITFLHTFFRKGGDTGRALLVVPANVLTTCYQEFFKWLPPKDSEDGRMSELTVERVVGGMPLDTADQKVHLYSQPEHIERWAGQTGSVLIISSRKFQDIALEKNRFWLKLKQDDPDRFSRLHTAILQGPSVVVVDEAHELRNPTSKLCRAMSLLRTKRRLALTGYPLQNNLNEYYTMICWVKPEFLGSAEEFKTEFTVPIEEGRKPGASREAQITSASALSLLDDLTSDFIHRAGPEILRHELPPKVEHVLYCKLGALQERMYQAYLQILQQLGVPRSLFRDFEILRKICNFPAEFEKLMEMGANASGELALEEVDEEEGGDGATVITVTPSQRAGRRPSGQLQDVGTDAAGPVADVGDEGAAAPMEVEDAGQGSEHHTPVRAAGKGKRPAKKEVLPQELCQALHTLMQEERQKLAEAAGNSSSSPGDIWSALPKDVLLEELVRECASNNEQLVVFTQSLPVLDHCQRMLLAKFGYEVNKHVLRIEGKVTSGNRQKFIDKFNKQGSQVKVMLVSTKAGALGINLTAARRMVIYDVPWNPVHNAQAIARIYRFGQTRPSYVYRLVYAGTMEQHVYRLNIHKEELFHKVVDKKAVRKASADDASELYHYQPHAQLAGASGQTLEMSRRDPSQLLPAVELHSDEVLAQLGGREHVLRHVLRYHSHDSMLPEDPLAKLARAERKAAARQYTQANANNARCSQRLKRLKRKYIEEGEDDDFVQPPELMDTAPGQATPAATQPATRAATHPGGKANNMAGSTLPAELQAAATQATTRLQESPARLRRLSHDMLPAESPSELARRLSDAMQSPRRSQARGSTSAAASASQPAQTQSAQAQPVASSAGPAQVTQAVQSTSHTQPITGHPPASHTQPPKSPRLASQPPQHPSAPDRPAQPTPLTHPALEQPSQGQPADIEPASPTQPPKQQTVPLSGQVPRHTALPAKGHSADPEPAPSIQPSDAQLQGQPAAQPGQAPQQAAQAVQGQAGPARPTPVTSTAEHPNKRARTLGGGAVLSGRRTPGPGDVSATVRQLVHQATAVASPPQAHGDATHVAGAVGMAGPADVSTSPHSPSATPAAASAAAQPSLSTQPPASSQEAVVQLLAEVQQRVLSMSDTQLHELRQRHQIFRGHTDEVLRKWVKDRRDKCLTRFNSLTPANLEYYEAQLAELEYRQRQSSPVTDTQAAPAQSAQPVPPTELQPPQPTTQSPMELVRQQPTQHAGEPTQQQPLQDQVANFPAKQRLPPSQAPQQPAAQPVQQQQAPHQNPNPEVAQPPQLHYLSTLHPPASTNQPTDQPLQLHNQPAPQPSHPPVSPTAQPLQPPNHPPHPVAPSRPARSASPQPAPLVTIEVPSDEQIAALQAEFPSFDAATIQAILAEYNEETRTVLQDLRAGGAGAATAVDEDERSEASSGHAAAAPSVPTGSVQPAAHTTAVQPPTAATATPQLPGAQQPVLQAPVPAQAAVHSAAGQPSAMPPANSQGPAVQQTAPRHTATAQPSAPPPSGRATITTPPAVQAQARQPQVTTHSVRPLPLTLQPITTSNRPTAFQSQAAHPNPEHMPAAAAFGSPYASPAIAGRAATSGQEAPTEPTVPVQPANPPTASAPPSASRPPHTTTRTHSSTTGAGHTGAQPPHANQLPVNPTKQDASQATGQAATEPMQGTAAALAQPQPPSFAGVRQGANARSYAVQRNAVNLVSPPPARRPVGKDEDDVIDLCDDSD